MTMLSFIQEGEEVEVIQIRGGERIKQRLESMGFVPGSIIRMVTNQHHGPAILKVKETRIAVGRGMLHHIYVQSIQSFAKTQEESQPHSCPSRHRFGWKNR